MLNFGGVYILHFFLLETPLADVRSTPNSSQEWHIISPPAKRVEPGTSLSWEFPAMKTRTEKSQSVNLFHFLLHHQTYLSQENSCI